MSLLEQKKGIVLLCILVLEEFFLEDRENFTEREETASEMSRKDS